MAEHIIYTLVSALIFGVLALANDLAHMIKATEFAA